MYCNKVLAVSRARDACAVCSLNPLSDKTDVIAFRTLYVESIPIQIKICNNVEIIIDKINRCIACHSIDSLTGTLTSHRLLQRVDCDKELKG